MPRDLLAGGEPHTGQGLHLADESVQHRNAQGAAGHERVQADVEIAALAILLQERGRSQIGCTRLCRAAHSVAVQRSALLHWASAELEKSVDSEATMIAATARLFITFEGTRSIPVSAITNTDPLKRTARLAVAPAQPIASGSVRPFARSSR